MECNFTQTQAITLGFILQRGYLIGKNGALVSLIIITCAEIIASSFQLIPQLFK